MDKSRLEIRPDLWLDWRRAAYIESHRTLVLADLHLGYAWAHRFNGQMLPLEGGDRLQERIADLLDYYKPLRVVLLGDIVHQAVPVKAIQREFTELTKLIAASAEPVLVLGNHDRNLDQLAPSDITLVRQYQLGEFLLVHGDVTEQRQPDRFVLMGHEHPAINLGDGVATSVKFPCFLASEHLLVLPAFSLWSSGSTLGSYTFMSLWAREARFSRAVAILGQKLLPVPLA